MKKGKNGHLKERNHFDGKDMILLVVTMLIIYGFFTWFANGGKTFEETFGSDNPTTMESPQSTESSGGNE